VLDFDLENDIGICFDGAIWDVMQNRIIKLGEGRLIVKAYYGKQECSQSEIKELYGSPPIFE